MTELSFLIDLLLNHKLPKSTQAAVQARIREVERVMASHGQMPAPALTRNTFEVRGIQAPAQIPAHMLGQSASTIAAMMRQEQAGGTVPNGIQGNPAVVAVLTADQSPPAPAPPPQPVAVVAQTPAAVAAINDRQTAIAAQISGKPEKGRTSPRKF